MAAMAGLAQHKELRELLPEEIVEAPQPVV